MAFSAILVILLLVAVLWNWGVVSEMIPRFNVGDMNFSTLMLVILLIFTLLVMITSIGRAKKVL